MPRSTWETSRPRHLAIIQSVQPEGPPSKLHLTKNSKTGISIDFPIHATCRPTSVCMGAGENSACCYALRGFMTFPNAVKQQARNQMLVEYLSSAPYTEVRRVADALWSDLPRGTSWLRWNGAGELSPGACRLINCFTRRHDDVLLWVISRRPDMVALLRDRKTLKLLLSLDHSTPKKVASDLREAARRFRLGAARLAYTRVSGEDIPPNDIHVVFNKHVSGNYNDWPHRKVCPASLPGAEHVGACDPCRRCFK